MTGFRSSRFSGKDLDSYLAEYDDPIVEEAADAAEEDDMEAVQKEIAWLRTEVANLRERLSSYKVPRAYVEIAREEVPMLHSNKVSRRHVEAMMKEKLGRE